MPTITHADIQTRAYFLWLAEGCPHGQHARHWAEAEFEERSLAFLAQPTKAVHPPAYELRHSEPLPVPTKAKRTRAPAKAASADPARTSKPRKPRTTKAAS